MSIVRWIFSLLLVIVALVFAFQNQDQLVSVKFLKWSTSNWPVWGFMYLAFVSGILTWIIVSAVKMLHVKKEVHDLKKGIQKLQNELNRLRNVSIEDDEGSDLPEE
ncbi:DUF1049 domain-containing protein [bacterium]|nr:DUF1049 domain-containing protein [bacterium]